MELIDPAAALLGTAPASEEHPWLNERQLRYRRAREILFTDYQERWLEADFERSGLDDVFGKLDDRYDAIDAHIDLDDLCALACLTVQERQCFMMSEMFDVVEIGRVTGLGAKTVRRRIISATQKLAETVKANGFEPDDVN